MVTQASGGMYHPHSMSRNLHTARLVEYLEANSLAVIYTSLDYYDSLISSSDMLLISIKVWDSKDTF